MHFVLADSNCRCLDQSVYRRPVQQEAGGVKYTPELLEIHFYLLFRTFQ
jgi:hypothetical protein